MNSGRRPTLMAMLLAVAMVFPVASCSDDDAADSTTTESTASSSTVAPADADSPEDDPDPATSDPATTDTTEPADPDAGDDEAAPALIDMVEITVLDHPMGAPADPVIADLVARFGPPDHDSGWGPTECPPSPSARFLGWSEGLRVYFSDIGGPKLDGAAFDTFEGDQWADLVAFPDGIGWGEPIETVATHLGATALYRDDLMWWEVWAGELTEFRSYISTIDGPVDRVTVGFEPRCT